MKPLHLTDNELLKIIYGRIQWDIRLNKSDIALEAKDGCVILSGHFDQAYRHAAAIEIISSTDGVRKLEDRSLVIRNYTRTDDEIKWLIEKQIGSFQLLAGEWIDVSVQDGVVTLAGVVFRPSQKAFAATDSWGLSGVQDCINMIEVRRPGGKARGHDLFKFERKLKYV